MIKQNRTKEEIKRYLLAPFTQVLFVSAFVFPTIYGIYRAWLVLTGAKADNPITIPAALLLGLIIIIGMIISGTLGELLWVFAMRPLLRRTEVEKWLNNGITSPSIERRTAKLLDYAYRTRK